MHARRYRPNFDSLDSRFLLSDASVGFAPGVGTVAVGSPNPATTVTNTEPPLFVTEDWLIAGSPPNDPYDPTTPPQGGVE